MLKWPGRNRVEIISILNSIMPVEPTNRIWVAYTDSDIIDLFNKHGMFR